MNDNLANVLSIYCKNEITDFKNHQLYNELNKLVNVLNYTLICEYGREINNNKSENLYLSISVYDEENKMIEILDEGSLTAGTMLVLVDKKQRVKFFSWNCEDFIDSIQWIIYSLRKSKN